MRVQVEVTEQNIIKFGLVQQTGNSAEDLMRTAKEAEEKGYYFTVWVEIPDDQTVTHNIFDTTPGRTVSEEELRQRENVDNPIMTGFKAKDNTGRKIEVTVEGVVEVPGDDVVDGEIVEDDD